MNELPNSVRMSDQWVCRITVGSTIAALGLSYRNQLDFATQRGGYPFWAALFFPLIIDSFVVVGELRVFSATAMDERGWHGFRIKAWAWLLTLGGLAASAAAGIAHVGLAAPADMKLAAAVAPLAAAASLGTGLGIVKLRAREARRADSQTSADVGVAAQQPSRGTTPAPARRSRVRHPGNGTPPPGPEVLAQMISDDQLARLPMGRRAFHKRHAAEGVTEHHARMALAGSENGSS